MAVGGELEEGSRLGQGVLRHGGESTETLGDDRGQTTMHSHPRPEEICTLTLVYIHTHSHMQRHIHKLNMSKYNGKYDSVMLRFNKTYL